MSPLPRQLPRRPLADAGSLAPECPPNGLFRVRLGFFVPPTPRLPTALALAVLLVLLTALLAPTVHRLAGDHVGRVLALVPAGLFFYFLSQVPLLDDGGVLLQSIRWIPTLEVDLAFRLDGLSLMFALLVTGLGALIALYAGSYLHGDPLRGRFLLYFFLFQTAMLGLVLADNLIAIFVFWELTSFSSYLLIGYKHQYEESRRSALQALVVTGTGGLVLLAGLVLLGMAADTFSLTEVLERGDLVRAHPLYLGVFVCIVIGCFAKSAQTPLHFWLPNAMAAPTPVSAYLHSATMVKAGVYLLARLHPTLGYTDVWFYTLTIFGTVTMVTGAVMAMRHSDLKKILAYTTITALGTLVMLLGLSVEGAIKAAMVFLLVHALYKGTLFLVAGSVDHESGTRDVLQLGGLRSMMPVTFAAALIAGLSMAGIPPLFGFIGKELAYEAALNLEVGWYLVPAAAVLANALTIAAAGVVVLRPFFGAKTAAAETAHEAPWDMWLGPIVLASGGLLMGIFPMIFSFPVLEPTVRAVMGEPLDFSLYLWHGVNAALILSIITTIIGVAFFFAYDRLRGGLTRLDPVMARGPEAGYFGLLDGTLRFGEWQTNRIIHGNLRYYVGVTLAVAFGLVAFTAVRTGITPAALNFAGVPATMWMAAGLVSVGAAFAALSHSRLLAVSALGVSGFGVALLYIDLSGPDLAMTQFLVETLIVVVILLVLQRLPSAFRDETSRAGRLRDAGIALVAGTTVTVVLLAVLRTPFNPELAEYFLAEAAPTAFGRNVVNVILVDFRAIDTLGEIVVLGVAALGAFALLWKGPAAVHRIRSNDPEPSVTDTAADPIRRDDPADPTRPHPSDL